MIPTAVLKEEQGDFNWDVFSHTTYSLDLIPSNFHSFPVLHDFLGGQWFYNEESLKKAVANFFKKKDPVFWKILRWVWWLFQKVGYNLEN